MTAETHAGATALGDLYALGRVPVASVSAGHMADWQPLVEAGVLRVRAGMLEVAKPGVLRALLQGSPPATEAGQERDFVVCRAFGAWPGWRGEPDPAELTAAQGLAVVPLGGADWPMHPGPAVMVAERAAFLATDWAARGFALALWVEPRPSPTVAAWLAQAVSPQAPLAASGFWPADSAIEALRAGGRVAESGN